MKVVHLQELFMLINKVTEHYAQKLLILIWEVSIMINTKRELKRCGDILIILIKVTSLPLKYLKL